MRLFNSGENSIGPNGESEVGPAPSRLVVLHVDDDPNDSALLQAAGRKAQVGFEVRTVEDGDQAIAYLSGSGPYMDRARHPKPALVLLDLKMPRATGFEILKWIRDQPALKFLQVIVLSGSELQDDIKAAYAAGANSYLVKPIGFDALVSLVKSINSVWLSSVKQPQV